MRSAPDEFTGVAALNDLRNREAVNILTSEWDDIDRQPDPRAFEAALFAHIGDVPSRETNNLLQWFGDASGYPLNSYEKCDRWLAGRSQSYMAPAWNRLAAFEQNLEVRDLARGALRGADVSQESLAAQVFSGLVQRIREAHRRIRDNRMVRIKSLYRETREFTIRFIPKNEPVAHYIWSMTGLTAKILNHKTAWIVSAPVWPHVVSLESDVRELDGVTQLFALLEKGRTGEIDLGSSRFLVVKGRPAARREEQLPRYTRVGAVPGTGLTVVKTLTENAARVRRILANR